MVLTGTCLEVCLEVSIFCEILSKTEMGNHCGKEIFPAEEMSIDHSGPVNEMVYSWTLITLMLLRRNRQDSLKPQ